LPILGVMGSLGAGEIILIAIVALVVFGPKRLPELARKASELLSQARKATQSFTDAMDSEYDGVTAPLKEMKTEYDETMRTIKGMVPTTPLASFTLPDGKPSTKSDGGSDASDGSSGDVSGEDPDKETTAGQSPPTPQEPEVAQKPAEDAGEGAVDDGGGS